MLATRRLAEEIRVAMPGLADPIEWRRAAFPTAQLRAAETRLEMMQGVRFSFAEEAERLFGVRPELKPLAAYDAPLAAVAAIVPGDKPLAERVETYLDRFTIPADRLQKVFDAAIARCRGRTATQVAMPEGESFDLQFVTGKSWSGYNYYMGDYHSIIQVNTDLPIRLSRALDLGCHEGYPGHHLLNMKLEEQLVRRPRLDRVQHLSALQSAKPDRRGHRQLRHRPRFPRQDAARYRARHIDAACRDQRRRPTINIGNCSTR